MLLTISVLLYSRADITEQFLKKLEAVLNQRGDVEVILRNQTEHLDDRQSEDAVFKCGLRNLIYVPSNNLGFNRGHNANLALAKGEYFAVLNPDLFLKDNSVFDKAIEVLKSDPKVGLVGLEGAPCSLILNAAGDYIDGRISRNVDYIEGSFLVGRTEEFRKFGLFSEVYHRMYFEDADLSLKFKQMGYSLKLISSQYDHLRSQSVNLVPVDEKLRIQRNNSNIFRKKWSRYLANPTFTNRILVKMNSVGIGDILCALTPVLAGLRKDYPTAVIEVACPFPELLIGNPYLSELYDLKREYKRIYDRVIDIKLNYASRELLAKEAERFCCTKLDSYLPQIFLMKNEIDAGRNTVEGLRGDSEQVVAVCLQNDRPQWQGKNWPREYIISLIEMLQSYDVKVIELGRGVESSGIADLDLVDGTSLREFCSVIATVDSLITIDSLALHVGQAFGTKTFALFGATDPKAWIIDWLTVFPIFCEDLYCIGCYQRKGDNGFNQCYMTAQNCMENLTPTMVMDHLTMGPEELLKRNIRLLQKES